MPSLYWTLREKLRLNPAVSKSIYIAQSALKIAAQNEFSAKVKAAAHKADTAQGVALCVRIRDEAPDLREFVEYYLAAGVEHLFFYEARSVDNFREVLEPFIADGHVTLIDNWPHIPISPAAEHDCVLRCIGRYRWLGCIDADEFVVVRDGRSIPEFLNSVPEKFPALALHCNMFGSSGHLTRPGLPVILAYTRRQPHPNLHVKVFLRPERVRHQRNPHSWYYQGLFSAAVNENGKRVWGSTDVPPTAEHAWINHYYHKSMEEFQRKGNRVAINDRVGIKFNSRTPQRGADYERTANQVADHSAIEYHRRHCFLNDCSVCSAYEQLELQSPGHSLERQSESNARPKSTAAVVICTRFRAGKLRECLRNVAQLKRQPDELIIVDNSMGDPATKELAREYSATYITEPRTGLSRARNRGLIESQSDVIAYLDDDSEPDSDWLAEILEPFTDAQVAVVTGVAVEPGKASIKGPQSHSSSLDKSDKQWFEIAAFGGLGIGTNMAIRKSACVSSDFFDERLGRGAPYHGMEEHFAFTQLISQNYRAIYAPSAIVYHTSQNPIVADREARSQFAYSMLLYSKFPEQRRDLLSFLFRRMRRKPLTWFRDAPDPGIVVSSSWPVLLKASISGALLYLKTRSRNK